jgi:gamma-glutamyltranspeptidase
LNTIQVHLNDVTVIPEHIGGIISREDLRKYTAKVKAPLAVNLNNGGYTVYSPRPPASGAVLQFILQVLDGRPTIEKYYSNVISSHSL